MGDPKFSRRKFETPSHPWEKDRIKEEHDLLKEFGLKNKKELWKAQSMLRKFRGLARDLQARLRRDEAQAEIEREQLLKSLFRLGVLEEGADLNDVLALTVETVLGRRLQTVVYRKGLANKIKQARQFIVHGHIAMGGRRMTIPGYLVRREDWDQIAFADSSPLINEMHPMRPRKEGAPPPEPVDEGAGEEEESPKEGKAEEEKPGEKKAEGKKPEEVKPKEEKAEDGGKTE
jgi:small subunit ribosomal protein S4